jgi:predicted nucleic acid-binding Zn ribbon protein
MQHARTTLRKIFAEKVCEQAGAEAPLLAWPVVCGAAVADKTRAVRFEDGMLVVTVPDVGWRSQLQSMSEQYLAGLVQVAGKQVKSISFVVASQAKR